MFLFEEGGGSLGTLIRYYNYLFVRDGFFQDQLESTRSVLHKSAISLLCARGRMGHAIILAYFKHAEIKA